MTARTTYDHGQFSWVDLLTEDADAAAAFYGAVFGWTRAVQDSDGGHPYSMFRIDGYDVAGMGEMGPGMKAGGVPSAWNSYVTVEDVETATARARELGGDITMNVIKVMEAGWMSFISDPTGAQLALWQRNEHAGAGLVNESGSFCWNELATRDLDRAAEFYGALLGWQFSDMPNAPSRYLIAKNQGRDNGGLMQMTDAWGDAPPHWGVYFAVDDVDGTAAGVRSAGGTVRAEPFDTEVGRIGVFTDPQGASFSVIRLTDQSD